MSKQLCRINQVLTVMMALIVVSCSTTRLIPEGQYLLKDVDINIDNPDVSKSDLEDYLVQKPNDNVIGLWIYNWSGAATSKCINRQIRKIVSAPVIYNYASPNQSAD